jgi:ketosteroid isomerase-like protein
MTRVSGLLLVLLAATAQAQTLAQTQAPAQTAAQVADAFHVALHRGDREAALALLAPEALVYEQGFAKHTRQAYAEGHLATDISFAGTTERSITRRESWEDMEFAWVLSEFRARGSFETQPVDILGTETMVLQRAGSAWRIVHIHWSWHSADE